MYRQRYGHMVHEHAVRRVRGLLQDRVRRLAGLHNTSDAEAYVNDIREKAALCFPALPEKTDLRPRTTGMLDFKEFKVEKVVYESRPDFLVTANLYVPADLKGEAPCVLGLCGHTDEAKAYGPYQLFAQGLVRKGFVVLIIDPVSQGERRQFYDEEGVPAGDPEPSSTTAHNLMGNPMLLAGDYLGSWMLWDATRGLDYLLQRPETDVSRVGVTGCSGGGTQTTHLTAIDPRITMAAPNCYITSWLSNLENELPTDAEQNPPRCLELGLDEADLLLAFAPRPTLIMAEENCFFDLRGARQAHADMKRVHSLLGSPQSAEISVGPLDHGYHKHAREAMYRFFLRHGGDHDDWQEPEMEEIPEAQLHAACGAAIPFGSRKVFDFMRTRVRDQAAKRPSLTMETLRASVQRRLHLEIPEGQPPHRFLRSSGGQDPETGKGYQFAAETEPGIQVILTMFGDLENPCRLPRGELTLYAGHVDSEQDCIDQPWLRSKLEAGERILAVDVRGMGQSMPATCGSRSLLEPYGADYMYASYGSMTGQSYLGRRVYDLLGAMNLLIGNGADISLAGRGVGSVVASLAALLHGSLPRCTITDYLPSYQLLIDNPLHNWPLSSFIEGCLAEFDLPEVYAALGPRLALRSPWGAWIPDR